MGRFARRFGERQSRDPLGHLWAEGLNPRGPGLVAPALTLIILRAREV
jgi:hypothetical protein